jgi:hypothetical protein
LVFSDCEAFVADSVEFRIFYGKRHFVDAAELTYRYATFLAVLPWPSEDHE